MNDTPAELAVITDLLVQELAPLRFGPPVTHVYQPLDYARPAWDAYCARFGRGPRPVLLVGLNPGPFGMAQVGVPFGEVAAVRDWMGISAPIGRPANEHPRRPIDGFGCTRSEVSGARLWGWARDRFVTPEAFFSRFFVANWCPLVFMEASGRNRTPDKLPTAERLPLEAACDRALAGTIALLRPDWVVGIGAFAEARVRRVLGPDARSRVGRVPHPSPASPTANRDWAGQMDRALAELGISLT